MIDSTVRVRRRVFNGRKKVRNRLRRFLLGSSILAVIGSLGGAAPVAGAEKGASATTLSAYGDYAKEVSAECIRNRAYGLSTNGVSLPVFCARLGNEQALRKHRQLHPDAQGSTMTRPYATGGLLP
jgi:hypothetical protein